MATGIENFSRQLQRNFELMRDLDQRTEDLRANIEKLTTEYTTSIRNLNSKARVAILIKIREAYGKWKEFSDHKLQIAMESYDVVDRHIEQLDRPEASFESDLKEKLTDSSEDDSSYSKRKKRRETQKKRKSIRDHYKGQGSDEEALESVKKKLNFECTSPEYGMPLGTSDSSSPSDMMDMSVDTHEVTCCVCDQVSYGKMIGCDNPNCAIEWFHFDCVGLTTKPQGKWFCPSCSKEEKK